MKKKLWKTIKKLEARIQALENPVHEVRQIGFQQLSNLYSENEFLEEGEEYGYELKTDKNGSNKK